MRKSLAVVLAAVSFGLGAWLSPRLAAQSGPDWTPETPRVGQRVTLTPAESTSCNVERVANHWILCKGGTWRNLTNGTGFFLHPADK